MYKLYPIKTKQASKSKSTPALYGVLKNGEDVLVRDLPRPEAVQFIIDMYRDELTGLVAAGDEPVEFIQDQVKQANKYLACFSH